MLCAVLTKMFSRRPTLKDVAKDMPRLPSQDEWNQDRKREASEKRVMAQRVRALTDRVLAIEQAREEDDLEEIADQLRAVRENLDRVARERLRK